MVLRDLNLKLSEFMISDSVILIFFSIYTILKKVFEMRQK